MQKLNKPELTFKNCYEVCECSNKKKEQLCDYMYDLEYAHIVYEELAISGSLHTYQPMEINKPARDTLISLYTYDFVNKKRPGRAIYDKLILSSLVCPYCNYGISSTLDHYLAKSKYPEFSINPSNLVPSCRDCNTEKKDKVSIQEDEQYLHPYFDTIDFPWLTSKVLFNNKPIIEFSVKKDVLNTILGKRIYYPFYTLKINNTYEICANDRLQMFQKYFKELEGNLKAYLLAESKKYPMNNWEKSFYECLAISDKFCALT